MLIRLLIYGVLFSAITYAVYNFSVPYKYTDLSGYTSMLMGVSSMVFTLMGIWIAFLYPNALQRLMNPEKIENADFSASLNETKRLEGLVGSVLRSAFVVVVLMLLSLAKLIFSGLPFFITYIDLLKALVLSSIVVLSILQMESIFYVIYSNVMFINELHRKREDREADADI